MSEPQAEGTDFNRLRIEQQTYLANCDENLKRWETFKDDYVKLKERLKSLPNELKHDVMVPFGKFAFMPGKIVKTNEVLVLLGDNWFVERSTKQACEIIDRRLSGIEKHLEKLQQEINIFKDQLNWTNDLIKETEQYINIEEKYKEEEKKPDTKKKLSEEEKQKQRLELQEKAKRAQMRINERIQNSKISKVSIKEENEKCDEEEINEVEEVSSNFENKLVVDEKTKKNSKLKDLSSDDTTKKKSVRWSDAAESVADEKIGSDSDDSYSDENEYEHEEEEEEEEEGATETCTNVIRIRHTPVENEVASKTKNEDEVIQTPADIYRVHYKPKSILKSLNDPEIYRAETLNVQKKDRKDESMESIPFEPQKAFTGQIVERTIVTGEAASTSNKPTTTSEDTSKGKRVSKFKASKQNS